MTDLNDVAVWFQAAKPGEKLVYHTGHLAYDCSPEGGWKIEKRKSLRAAADFLMKSSDAGAVILVQRRVANKVFDYIAVRTSCP